MATIAGKDGDIDVAGYDHFTHAWTVDLECEALEDTNWDWTGDDIDWKSYISGLKGWSGSFECYIDAAQDPPIPCGVVAAAKFYVDKDNSKGVSGSVLITGVHPGVTIEGIQEVSVDWTGSGAPAVGAI